MAIVDALLERNTAKTGLVPVSLAVADYDRTRPLIDGRVIPKALRSGRIRPGSAISASGRFTKNTTPAEMSLSWYVMARMRGEPVVALPVFPLRMPVLAYVFVHRGRAVHDAKGSRRQENRDDAVSDHGQLVAARNF